MEEIDDKILTHNLDGSAHGQSNEAVYNHRITALLDHVSYSIYNVKMNPAARIYKAIVGPGFEADFTTIQQAIDWAHLYGGGIVHVKAGTYVQTDDIILYSNIQLQGEDDDTTILDFNGLSKQIKIIGTSGTRKRNVEVKNLQVKGVFDRYAFTLDYVDDIHFERVNFVSFTQDQAISGCIDLNHAKRVLIERCRGTDCWNFISQSASEHIFIHNNYIDGGNHSPSLFRHINNYGCKFCEIKGNYFFGYSEACIYAETYLNDSVISNNFFEDGDTAMLWIYSSDRLQIIGNSLRKNLAAGDGIQLSDGDRCIIMGNNIYDISGDGIRLGNHDRSVVNGNIVNSAGGWGVNVESDNCNDNIVTSNVLKNNVSGGLQDLGTGTTVANNEV
jgi:parallel beta-helix repeat protein